MSATPGAVVKAAPAAGRSRLRIYALEVKAEFLKLLRSPTFVVPTLVAPLLFYVIFGLTFAKQYLSNNIRVPTYMLATYGTFGVVGVSLFSFGVGIATERAQGWLILKRVSPMPPEAFFIAKIIMATMFNLLIVVMLFILGATLGGARLEPQQWLTLGGVLLLGSLPFTALGLAMGYFAGANTSPALANLIYMPMSFASGLWLPLEMLPSFVQRISVFMPPYHFAQLALRQIGAGRGGNPWVHVLALLGFTVVFIALAVVGYRREESSFQ
ncbi:MAG: ABC transporter permease [Hyalangium sp.]|uniref:ABC transporter permease n=1 Tax=Hyalangium sp. TaxID=2028555 RepID=UPI00389A70C3